MTISLTELLLLMLIAAVVGTIARQIAGGVRGGLLVSIVVGFIGALLGPWLAHQLRLAEPLVVRVDGHPFGILVDHRRSAVRGPRSPGFRPLPAPAALGLRPRGEIRAVARTRSRAP